MRLGLLDIVFVGEMMFKVDRKNDIVKVLPFSVCIKNSWLASDNAKCLTAR